MDRLGTLGLVAVLAAIVAYATMLFVLQRFTYRTWIFDSVVGLGLLLAGGGWIIDGLGVPGAVALVLGAGWFLLGRRELRIQGSHRLNIKPGDRLPSMSLHTTDGTEVTDRDLVAHAPTLLVLYRGWWCPSHRAQLDELTGAYERLGQAGLSVYAGSVDSPAESAPIQEHVGDKITILCDVPNSLLDEIGVRDTKGAPWYDRLVFGAREQSIAMPAAIVVDSSGTVVYSYRATRIDDRPDPDRILAHL
jgi:peroxiredoxin